MFYNRTKKPWVSEGCSTKQDEWVSKLCRAFCHSLFITMVTDAEHELTCLVKTASATFSLILLFTACFKCSVDYLLGEWILYGQLEINFTLICQQSKTISTCPLLGYGMVTLMFKYISRLKFQSS